MKEKADFASEWVSTIRKLHPSQGQTMALQLEVDLDILEKACCQQLQAKGGQAVNPFEPDFEKMFTLGRFQLDASRVLNLLSRPINSA